MHFSIRIFIVSYCTVAKCHHYVDKFENFIPCDSLGVCGMQHKLIVSVYFQKLLTF